MNTLTIDIGNTKIKAGIFSANVLQEIFVYDRKQVGQFEHLIPKYGITQSILCNVGEEEAELENLLAMQTHFHKLSGQSALPFSSAYKTPQTLGMDRVAAVAGALHFFDRAHCLVIDAGTCITFDFITSDHRYLGGAISPGLQMRLNAMHHFTHKLPLLPFAPVDDFTGNTTETAMLSGAYFGMLGEINETISRYEERHGTIQVITCGGDSVLFDKHIKRNIFAAPYLVLYGLNKILSLNVT
jgi:type III pantothenate kinase